MTKQRTWTLAALGALGLAAFLGGAGKGWTKSFGTPLADRPLTVLSQAGGEILLLPLPGLREGKLLASLADAQAPAADKSRMADSLLMPGVLGLGGGKSAWRQPEIRQLAVTDPVTGETFAIRYQTLSTRAGRLDFAVPTEEALQVRPGSPGQFLVNRNLQLYLVDAAAGTATPLGDQAERGQLKRLAFATETRRAEAGDPHPELPLIWAMGARFSPDGAKIVFQSNRDGIADERGDLSIWIHDVATGRETRLAAGRRDAPISAWGFTAAGEVLANRFAGGRASLVALNPNGGERRLAAGTFVAQSPDRKRAVVMSLALDRRELRLVDVESGRDRLIFREDGSGLRLRSLAVSFAADGQSLVTDLEDAGNRQSLLVYHPASQEARRLALPQGQLLSSAVLTASFAGEQLVVPVENPRQGWNRTYLVDVNE